MFEHNFDPYEELIKLKLKTDQLIQGHNHHDAALGQLAAEYNKLLIQQRQILAELQKLRHDLTVKNTS